MNTENRAAELHAVLADARAVRPGEHVLIFVAKIGDGGVDTTLAARVASGGTVYADDLMQTANALAQAATAYARDVALELANYQRRLS